MSVRYRLIASMLTLFGRSSLFFFFICAPLAAQGLKKVIILDFKNFDKNPNYQYLEASITDAVRQDLKSRFAFKEMPPVDWQNLANTNFFAWPEENYTKGFAMYLGTLAKQDIAIGGYYQAVRRKGKKTEIIQAHIFILDIGKKNLISEFEMSLPADSELFTSVNTLASRVADESKSILPNEKDFKQFGIVDEPGGLNEFSITGGLNVFSLPAAFNDNFSSSTNLFPKDIKNVPQIEAGYTRHDFILARMQLSGLGGVQFGSGELKTATDTKTIRTSLLGISLAGHLGYRFELWRFYFTPILGGGFYVGNFKLDYSTLSVLPVDSTGADKSSTSVNISAPFFEGGVQLGFQINRALALQLTGHYRQYTYIGSTSGQVFVGGGLNFRL